MRWVEGARPKTLPAALVPLFVGTSIAMTSRSPSHAWVGNGRLSSVPEFAGKIPMTTLGFRFPLWLQLELNRINWIRLLLTAVVALALQVGVNYANDYSDGVKGTDENRVGPLRLVGSGLVPPATVKRAALLSFLVAAAAGFALAAQTSWWLLAIGAAAILAAWGYTGGPKPYGYLGLGELFVFVFFGLVATIGTVYIQDGIIPDIAWFAAVAVGFSSVALLEANNLRDVTGDTAAGKKTLAVRLGRARGSWLYLGSWVVVALGILDTSVFEAIHSPVRSQGFISSWSFYDACLQSRCYFGTDFGVPHPWWPLLGLLGMVGLGSVIKLVRSPAEGRALLPLLGATGKAQLRTGLLFSLGICLTLAH